MSKTKKAVYIVHGFGGMPNGGWRPWLMGRVGRDLDIFACSLKMPNPDNPKKAEWVKEISRNIQNTKEDVILVGHSLGVPAVLRYLESLPKGKKILGAVLVSGPVFSPEEKKYKPIKNFFTGGFDFEKIKKSCKNFAVIHGDNDTVVDIESAYILSGKLNCSIDIVKNGGHLNGSSGCYELPEAYLAILRFLKVNKQIS